jgi:uncharacterized protein (TIGR02679 family)
MTATAEQLDYLQQPAFARLWHAARQAWERRGGPAGNAVVRTLSEQEALAISGLLGRRQPLRPEATLRLPLAELDRVLQGSFATTLAAWLERCGGPLADHPAERAQAARARVDMWRSLCERAERTDERLLAVVEDLRATGLGRRLAAEAEGELLVQALNVLERILALERPIDVAVLAARCCGDAKALNDGAPVGTVVLRGLAVLNGIATPSDAAARRGLWAGRRVLCDALSSRVLVLNLAARGRSVLARTLQLSAEAGEPRVLTLRELATADDLRLPEELYACENPTVLSAAADHLGAEARPLVCAEGWPSVACWTLLDLAAAQGVKLRYHGDFDWPGLQIAGRLLARDAQPWRLGAADYLDAITRGALTRPLEGLPVAASWDPLLPRLMVERRAVVEEEGLVLDNLLADLAA